WEGAVMEMTAHLVVLPILLPLFAGALLALVEDRHHRLKLAINAVATAALLIVALWLAVTTVNGLASGGVVTYRLGDWPAPFAIVLVQDRLAAMMVLLTTVLAAASLSFS